MPAKTELLIAAHHFAVDPKETGERLAAAILKPQAERLYSELREFCAAVLKAPITPLARERVGALIVAIGEDAQERRRSPAPPAEPTLSPMDITPAATLFTAAEASHGRSVRLPYKDDEAS